MKPNQASRTAEYMALFRAIESARPASRRLFNDPFAREFLRPSLRAAAQVSRIPLLGKIIPFIIDTRWAGARTSGIARTRLIDEILVRALNEGAQQIVILGAGFDCRAYRIDGINRVRVIEIDHPDTLNAKRRQLQHLLGSVPNNVQFVAADFNQQSLEEVISATSFDAKLQTFFIWEGVTNYLTAEAVDATFRSIRRIAERSSVLFTYVDKAVLDSSDTFEGTESLNQTLRQVGERWTFGFDPNEVGDYLRERGFQLVEDIGSVEYRARYLKQKRRYLRGYEFYRVALAESRSL